jgi:hypothetical protein
MAKTRKIIEFNGYVKDDNGDWIPGRERAAVAIPDGADVSAICDALDTQESILKSYADNPSIVGTVDDSEYPGRGSDGNFYTISSV